MDCYLYGRDLWYREQCARLQIMKWMILLFCAFRLWPSDVAGVILCDETCASPDRGNASVCIQEKDSRQEILLLGLFPCNSPNFMARGLTVAAQMAVRQISYNDSQRDRLLQGYRLKLAVENTQVSRWIPSRTA